jgi:hypothetical protein
MRSEITPEMDAAYDILTDGGIAPEKAARIALLADRGWRDGSIKRTPEQYARHFLNMRAVALSDQGSTDRDG